MEFPRSLGRKNVVFLERLDEFVDVCAHGLQIHAAATANFIRDVGLIPSLFEEFQDSGSDWIQAEHLAMKDVEHNPSVSALCVPDGVRDSWHWPNASSRSRECVCSELS
jgi:hypothetical protein